MFPEVSRQHEVIKRGCLLILSHKEFMQDPRKNPRNLNTPKAQQRTNNSQHAWLIEECRHLHRAHRILRDPEQTRDHQVSPSVKRDTRGWNNNTLSPKQMGVKSLLSSPEAPRCQGKLYSPTMYTFHKNKGSRLRKKHWLWEWVTNHWIWGYHSPEVKGRLEHMQNTAVIPHRKIKIDALSQLENSFSLGKHFSFPRFFASVPQYIRRQSLDAVSEEGWVVTLRADGAFSLRWCILKASKSLKDSAEGPAPTTDTRV